CCSCRRRRPRARTLFPYTTLFRSRNADGDALAVPGVPLGVERAVQVGQVGQVWAVTGGQHDRVDLLPPPVRPAEFGPVGLREQRSEEHTSELQSRENLVCRLLLEK